MNSFLKNAIEKNIGSPKSIVRLQGGDISQKYKVETSTQEFVVKMNKGSYALAKFEAEQKSLKTLAETKVIGIQDTYGTEQEGDTAILIMEYIKSKMPDQKDFERLGYSL